LPTRSALVLLFGLLVAVPVGAAVYLGAAGLGRERSMLIEQERVAMQGRADELRDRLVFALQQLYARELKRGPAALVPDAEPIRDFADLPASELEPDGQLGKLPQHSAIVVSGDTAVRFGANPDGTFRTFRIDADKLNRRFLDPVSPLAVVTRVDTRLDYARLVRTGERRSGPKDRFGLKHLHYRHVVPARADATPPLLPENYVLELGMHPAAALGRQLDAASETLLWTLGAVTVVVVLGLLFAWRALLAESRLASRKAEFVSAVSHELRTPLTSIRMYADMLKEGWVKDSKTAAEYFDLISAESERLARLVNNVLDFSRIEKGKKGFHMQLGDPAPVVRDAAEVLTPYLRAQGFELELQVPDSLPECSFDKDALTQILVNLIDNAVKYGEEEVRVEAEARNGEVVLSVLDRGPGVPADERESIFEAFIRGRNAEAGGSGLGLALVKHYAAAHQGTIEVLDRAGGGAIFALHLPAT